MKGKNDHELYAALDINDTDLPSVSIDVIKKQYKKISLSCHPDKLAQRGVTVTEEDKQKFLKCKEAYDVLSDPKRRGLYDDLGMSGLKLLENPAELNPIELLKNFQNNSTDRCSVVLIIASIFAAIILVPVLFSLKCDGDLDDAPWTAIWIPVWIVDFAILIMACLMFQKKEKKSSDSEDEDEKDDDITFEAKLYNLVTTVLFILIQIFVLLRLDGGIEWSWFVVFIPWFLYEIVSIAAFLPAALFTTIPLPDHEMTVNLIDKEEGQGEEDIFMQKLQNEGEYFNKLLQQHAEQKTIIVNLLRLWLAIFFALKFDGSVDWNYGLVFLPVWIFFFVGYIQAFILNSWGDKQTEGIDLMAIINKEDTNPEHTIKVKQGEQLKSTAFTQCCIAPILPLFFAVMLVCRVQVPGATYSTFLIILPVFIGLGCCCLAVFCGLCCFAYVDTTELEEEIEKAKHMQEPDVETAAADVAEGYVPPEPEVVVPPAPPISAPSNEYGTFKETNPQVEEEEEEGAKPTPEVHTIDEDID